MFRSLLAASFVVFTSLAAAQAPGAASGVPPGATDWGGGFYTGVDTATQMSSNSATGAGSTVDAPTADIARRCAALAGYATLYSQIDPIRQRFAQIPDAPTLVQSAVIVPAAGSTIPKRPNWPGCNRRTSAFDGQRMGTGDIAGAIFASAFAITRTEPFAHALKALYAPS